MESIQQALAATDNTTGEILALLRAMRVLLTLSESRMNGSLAPEAICASGQVRKVTQDVRDLYSICHVLAELAMGLSAVGRDSIEQATGLIADAGPATPELVALTKSCHRSLADLSAAVKTVTAVQRCMVESQEALDEVVLRQDPSPQLRDEVRRLIDRLRGENG